MKEYIVFSLGELLANEQVDITQLKECLSNFNCEREKDLSDFLKSRAITYDNANIGKTSLIIDSEAFENGQFRVMAFYTIGLTAIDISNMSKSKKKKILGNVPGRENLNNYHAFLIGQLGRDDRYQCSDIPGEVILKECYNDIRKSQKITGGRLLLLECRPHMFEKFYGKHGFIKLQEEISKGLLTLYKRIDF